MFDSSLHPDRGDTISNDEAAALLTANALFGSLFIICFFATIMMVVRRKIDDLFLKYALVCLIVALGLSAIMCFVITSY